MILNWRKIIGLDEWRSHLVMIAVFAVSIGLVLIVDERQREAHYIAMWAVLATIFIILSILMKGTSRLTNNIRKRSQLFVPIPVVAISGSFISSAILMSLSKDHNISDTLLYLLFNIWIGIYILVALFVLALIPKKRKKRKPSAQWPSVQNIISMSLVVAESILVLLFIITVTDMLRLVSLRGA